jgi:uncharacterized RDD family membrane protein YckC
MKRGLGITIPGSDFNWMAMPPLLSENQAAPIWRRILAQLTDYVVALLLIAILAAPWQVFLSAKPSLAWLTILFTITGYLAAIGYRLMGDGLFSGAAVGKRLFGLKCISRSTGEACSINQSLARNAILVIPIIQIVELILLCSDGKVRWGDNIAETWVIRRNPLPEPEVVPTPMRPADFRAIRESLQRPKQDT